MEAETRLNITFTKEEREVLAKAYDILDDLFKLDAWDKCDSKTSTNYVTQEEVLKAACAICWLLQ